MVYNSIDFNNFIEKFYTNNNREKMILHIDIDNDKTNIYDIHNLLLDLLLEGFQYIEIKNNNLIKSIETLQYYFDNIDIKIIIKNLTKKELINDSSLYINRYARIDISDMNKRIVNGQHIIVNSLNKIKTFILIDNDNNLSIEFNYIRS